MYVLYSEYKGEKTQVFEHAHNTVHTFDFQNNKFFHGKDMCMRHKFGTH